MTGAGGACILCAAQHTGRAVDQQHQQTFRGGTLEDASREMRAHLGPAAHILHTREVRQPGILGYLTRPLVEITAIPAAPAGENVGTVQYFEKLVRDAQRRMNTPGEGTGAVSASAAPLLAFPPRKTEERDGLAREVQDIREMLQVLYAENPGAGLPVEFAPHYRTLIERGVSRKTAASLIAGVVKHADHEIIRDPRIFRERLHFEIRRLAACTGGIQLKPGICRVVAVCGATGVGKTTNIAKLAAHFSVKERMRVALLTTDTYRVAAVEQLRVYANIIGLAIRVAQDAKEVAQALEAFREHDLVLIDTAGGSQFNLEQIRELQGLLQAAKPHEIILALGAGAQHTDLHSVVHNFRILGPSSLMFTKLDETAHYGGLISLAAETGLPVSYLSVGQNVPDDLRVAAPGLMASLVLEGKKPLG